MTFSQDTYNQQLCRGSSGARGTLLGNWQEEIALRAATGEGRSLPQRHVKRKGLLKDFSRTPLEPRKLDNTFERVCGHAGAPLETGRATQDPTTLHLTSSSILPSLPPRKYTLHSQFLKQVIEEMHDPNPINTPIQTEYASRYLPAIMPVRKSLVVARVASPTKQAARDFRRTSAFTESDPLTHHRFRDEQIVARASSSLRVPSALERLKLKVWDVLESQGILLTGYIVSTAKVIQALESHLSPEEISDYKRYLERQLSTMQRGMVRVEDLWK